MKKILLFILFYTFSTGTNAQCYEELTFGGSHTTAKRADGTLWGWGLSAWGELSTNNSNDSEPLPIQLGLANDWSVLKNGVVNTFCIKNNGTLWGCGSNQLGSLGVNSTTQQFNTFQQITTATNWIKVAPSYFFTIALKADGTIWAWGQNDEYQLGNSPASSQQLFPIQVGTATDWVEIATGTSRTAFAIKADGTIWGWGSNPSSIIVAGSSTYTVSTPTQVGTSTDWVKMSVGGQHILAQKQDGTLWSWGGGTALGVGGTPSVTNIPQQVTNDTWKNFSNGSGTSFGIKADGTLWAWGVNTNGQLGDGTSTNRLVPTQIGTDTNWDTVQARNFSTTMATKTDGTVWYWGENYYGEFGNGTSYDTNYYNTPQQTTGVCVTALAGPVFQKDKMFSMYPNPAQDFVTIAYDLGIDNAIVEIYDISGRAINTYKLAASKGELQLTTSTYQAGIYIVIVKQNDTILLQQKLIIE
ncbi:T9SS type A sorting domain-containing protein [Flavobacterium gelidilacus]|uniref:T9SS type A sorting domain-containing protein n=1 Tax=Flavobacterium gelidilacus TaxID=206041 RepID=UPI00041C50EF|nr:T9SS type A sorting domain-containing protein [Flavobacterium gelidilacus]